MKERKEKIVFFFSLSNYRSSQRITSWSSLETKVNKVDLAKDLHQEIWHLSKIRPASNLNQKMSVIT